MALVALLLASAAFLLDRTQLQVWSGAVVFALIVVVAVPILRWVARTEGEPALFRLLLVGLVVKLLFSIVRYLVIQYAYGGVSDAYIYWYDGGEFARRFWANLPLHPLPKTGGRNLETQRIADITGGIFVVTGQTWFGGFFIFSAMCFTGQVLMLRAVRRAIPEANWRKYAWLVLFWPSLLFWPSSIGKEAVLLGCLGLLGYGAALLLAPEPRIRGVPIFGAGLAVVALIRPHVALMAVAGLMVSAGVGVLFRRSQRAGSVRSRAVQLVAIVGLILSFGAVSTQVSSLFDENAGEATSTGNALTQTKEQTSTGGSEFRTYSATSPATMVPGVLSVIFRPFPWEAHNLNSLIAAVECLLLAGLFALSWRSLLAVPLVALRRPFVVYAAVFTLVFGVAFSYVGNFGILARQRTQMLPLLFVLLVLPAVGRGAIRQVLAPAVEDADRDDPAVSATTGSEKAAGTLDPGPSREGRALPRV